MNSVAERLKKLRGHLRYSQKDFAKRLGILPATYSNYENEKRKLSPELLEKLYNEFNVNLNWLITGQGSMFNDELETIEHPEEELIKLPFHKESFVSAGFGIENTIDETINIAFSKPLLRIAFKINVDRGLYLLPVYGNSMTPTIPENAIVLVVDYKVEGILREGSIYVVKYDGEEFIKRVFKDPVNQKVKLISDNEEYPPIEVSGEDSNRFKILGRVVGYIAGV
ncbi:XRE family transcriptional regulator [Persephonella sp.]